MMSNLSMTQPLTAMDSDQQNTAKNVWQRLKRCCICASRFQFAFQFLHFCISMFFLWAGVVEFINHPPYFDAYGDAKKNIDRLPALNVSMVLYNSIILVCSLLLHQSLVAFKNFKIMKVKYVFLFVCLFVLFGNQG